MSTVPLPPLPADTGEPAQDYRPGGRSMVDLLADEHHRIDGLCAELVDDAADPGRRRQLAEVLTATVVRHLSAEEQYLYPTVRVAVPDGPTLADRELAADITLLTALRELTGTASADAEFDRRAERVAGLLRRHAAAAETDLFPPLRQVATDAELIRLGNRVEIAEEAAPTRPHPHTPLTPPWNRVVHPAVGMLDKVRDAVTRRRTYLEDLPLPRQANRRHR
ncbi:hemerythrin domain-containing protein [Plantactinospora sp. GCM10030261]|uniref:hemerythrin domain-containing protein n=1 Tax=Plantactinospora sp. GCM10030261 TaxID=3273420 RepID=UPI00361980F4